MSHKYESASEPQHISVLVWGTDLVHHAELLRPPRPCTLHPQPRTLHPQPLHPEPRTRNAYLVHGAELRLRPPPQPLPNDAPWGQPPAEFGV